MLYSFLKKIILILAILLASTANSADWMLLFQHLHNLDTAYEGAALSNLMQNLTIGYIHEENLPKNPLSYSAKSGNYPIRSPYQ